MEDKQSSAPIADSSEPTPGRKSKRRRSPRKTRPRRPRRSQLPPPIQLESTSASEGLENGKPESSGGSLFDGLKGIFGGESNGSEQPSSSNPKSGTGGKTSLNSDSLPAEVEAQLNAVPDRIGEGGEDIPGPVDVQQGGEAEMIGSLMDAVAFEEQDVKDLLAELFDWLAVRFDSEHWKLTERQMRILGRPTAQLANSVWEKLKARIPDILAQWCESTPGATAFLMAAGIVVAPKVATQIRLSRGRKRHVIEQPKPAERSKGVPATTQTYGVPAMAGDRETL